MTDILEWTFSVLNRLLQRFPVAHAVLLTLRSRSIQLRASAFISEKRYIHHEKLNYPFFSTQQPHQILSKRRTFQLRAGILIWAFSPSTTPPGPGTGATVFGDSSVLTAFTSS